MKCFRHLTGASQILHRFSDPISQSSTHLGRSLFEWYCNLEDYCCLHLVKRCLLPKTWRHEHVRIWQDIAREQSPPLGEDERRFIILENVWQKLWELPPYLADILVTMSQLKELATVERLEAQIQIKHDLVFVQNQLKEIRESKIASGLLQLTEDNVAPYPTRHCDCCPPPPFSPCTMTFPAAALLRVHLLALHNYMVIVLYGPIRDTGICIDSLETEQNTLERYSLEIARTYAAVEDALADELGSMLPWFNPLAMACFSCPENLRMWLWHKLAHFEESGRRDLEPLKKMLAVFWGIPDLLTKGFRSEALLEGELKTLRVDDITLAAKIVAEEKEETLDLFPWFNA